jgi:glycosyltransferase 2 family protein
VKKQSTGRRLWSLSWRIGAALLLLGWIFQLIFYNEAYLAWRGEGHDWEALTRWQRLQVAWTYGPPGVWETLKMIDLKYLLVAILLMGLVLFIGILRWQIILKVHGLAMPFSRTSEISLIAHFFNSFLLGSVGGDLLKAYYAARETHHKKIEAVVTVAVDRVMGLFSMVVLASVLLLPNRELIAASEPRLKVVVWIILGMTVGCAIFILLLFWGGLSRGIPQARVWLRKLPKGELMERSIEAFREFGRDRTFLLRVLPISMLGNAFCILLVLMLIWGFHLDAPVLAVSAIVMIVTCISSLPITPSGLGVRENLYVWFFTTPGMDIPSAQALLISLVGYATSLVWSLIGGFVYLTVRKKEHLEEIEEASADDSSDL